jgi:hypothetical protein
VSEINTYKLTNDGKRKKKKKKKKQQKNKAPL